ncbi:unnamed protein product [Pleuronectes platessa]|uniref:Uncharacterized protein n=1 Tax=Pleuronectes platessa TaxID=8262 RepID=A0A9N7YX64_PLEPL|nr:unnamed protein product [Pleuronectes platessa]
MSDGNDSEGEHRLIGAAPRHSVTQALISTQQVPSECEAETWKETELQSKNFFQSLSNYKAALPAERSLVNVRQKKTGRNRKTRRSRGKTPSTVEPRLKLPLEASGRRTRWNRSG